MEVTGHFLQFLWEVSRVAASEMWDVILAGSPPQEAVWPHETVSATSSQCSKVKKRKWICKLVLFKVLPSSLKQQEVPLLVFHR